MTLKNDLHYGFRRLRQAPGFTVACVLTLALGIGANTAIFTLIHAVMLKSLPVKNPHELYRLGRGENCCVLGGMQDRWDIFSYAFYRQLRDHTPEFREIAAFEGGQTDLSVRRNGSNAPALPFAGEMISGNYFSTFGVNAFAGRTITPADDQPDAAPVAVMSYRAWQEHFGLDPSVVGSAFTINQVPYTVAGIAPPGFFGDRLRADPPDFWIPIATEPMLHGPNSILNRDGFYWLYAIGRLRPGVNPAGIQPKVTAMLQRWLAARPDLSAQDRAKIGRQQIPVTPAGGGVSSMADETSAGLRLLMILSGLVLLIACANVANLLLARGAASRVQSAIRVALGAPRARLIRQTLMESVLLAVAGGLAGLAVAFAGTRTILLVFFRGAHYVPIDASPSLAVLGFAFLLSLLTGMVFGLAPAWIAARSDPAEALRGAGRSTRDRTSLPQRSLVVMQVALSAVLLIGAGLLTQSLRNLENQRFGFEPQGRVVVRVNPALAGYKPERLSVLYDQIETRLTQIPGVASASYSIYSPMRGDNWSFGIHIQGRPPEEEAEASFNRIGPRYFETLGTHLLRGRTIGMADTPNSPEVAVINQAFAHKFFPKEDPIGKHFGMGDPRHSGEFEIVGIVEDTKYQDARGPAYPTFFMPFLQISKDPQMSFMIASHYIGDIELRVAGPTENLNAAVRRALAQIDPNLTVLDMLTMDEQLARNFNQDRLIARLTGIFGGLALMLACVGLYGITAYAVARRTGEIGIRMALGADRPNIVTLILRDALLQLAVGLAIGIPAALAGGRLLAHQLYGVEAYNPAILSLAAGVLAACAVLAGYLPARRAAAIDPIRALRVE
ncbi:MAG TPA: ABC transporter permease [Bryobacteraceae bacterium]|nr:ABC transporter permease [Bryobacteraceae bacterium]